MVSLYYRRIIPHGRQKQLLPCGGSPSSFRAFPVDLKEGVNEQQAQEPCSPKMERRRLCWAASPFGTPILYSWIGHALEEFFLLRRILPYAGSQSLRVLSQDRYPKPIQNHIFYAKKRLHHKARSHWTLVSRSVLSPVLIRWTAPRWMYSFSLARQHYSTTTHFNQTLYRMRKNQHIRHPGYLDCLMESHYWISFKGIKSLVSPARPPGRSMGASKEENTWVAL